MQTPDKRQLILYNYLLDVKQLRSFDVAFIWDMAYTMLREPSHKYWRLVDRKTEKLILNNNGLDNLPQMQPAPGSIEFQG